MRAVSMRIHNFRTFADTEIDLSPYSLLIGANNAGKSNVIDAIRVFYEKDKDLKYDQSRDFPKFLTEDQESWVEITFRPSTVEFETLKEEYRLPGGVFCIRKYLQSSEVDGDGKQKTGIYAYVGGQLSDSRFYGAKNVQQGKFGEIIYVPAVSKLDEHTKLTGPSALRDLINAVLKKVIRTSAAYNSLREAFDAFGEGLRSETTEDGQSLARLESEITAEIAEWGTSFELYIDAISPDDLIKSLVGHRVRDDSLDRAQDPKAYGQGFQRHLIFTLIKLAALYSTATPVGVRNDFSPQLTWLLFEEPEAFLHPSQIDTLDSNLGALSEGDGAQVLITTHSPRFVSKNIEQLPSLIRVGRDDVKSITWQIDDVALGSILGSNQADMDRWMDAGIAVRFDDLQIEMESIKYALWLNPLRCSAFFANKILLVEGPTEVALIGYMMDKGRISTSGSGIFVLDTLGKYNVHRFMNLFGAMGILHAVLCDNDGGRGSDRAIKNTIESSRNPHTLGFNWFGQDIEAFLGLPKAGRPDRKPQHVMWHLSRGNISEAKLAELANMVEALLKLDGPRRDSVANVVAAGVL